MAKKLASSCRPSDALRRTWSKSLHTTLHTLGVERTADDVVTYTGKVLDTTATDQNDGVLLQVVTDTGDLAETS